MMEEENNKDLDLESFLRSDVDEIRELMKAHNISEEITLRYIRRVFHKESLEELNEEEIKKLRSAMERYIEKKRKGEKKEEKGIRVNGYRIVREENGIFHVVKDDGTTYTVNPFEGLCDCPDMRFRTRNECKHIRMIIEHVPEVKKKIEEKEKERGVVMEKMETALATSFEPIDRWNKEEVLSKLTDTVIQKYYVYEFEQDGRSVIGLTADCVVDIAHWIGGIETVDEHVMDAGDKYMAKVTVKDKARDFVVSGFAEELKWYGKGRPNKFAARIAYRKAQRNALLRLIPKPLIDVIIQRYKELKSSRSS